MNVAGFPEEFRWLFYLSCPGLMIRWPGMPQELTTSTIWIFIGLGAVANAVIYGGLAFVICGILKLLRRVRSRSGGPLQQ